MTDHRVGTRTLAELFDGRSQLLDRAPKGRDECDSSQLWIRRQYEYEETR